MVSQAKVKNQKAVQYRQTNQIGSREKIQASSGEPVQKTLETNAGEMPRTPDTRTKKHTDNTDRKR